MFRPSSVTQTQNPNTIYTLLTNNKNSVFFRKVVLSVFEGVTLLRTTNKVGIERTPTALPLHKCSRLNLEAFVNSVVSSQQDGDGDMAYKLFLELASQKVDFIEIGLTAKASVECHTLNSQTYIYIYKSEVHTQ